MELHDVNTKAGLLAHVMTREGLHQVLEHRADYGAKITMLDIAELADAEKLELDSFVLFGRLLLDQRGGVLQVRENAFTSQQWVNVMQKGPVITEEQFMKFVDDNGVDRMQLFADPTSSSGGCSSCAGGCCSTPVDPSNLPPPPKAKCEICSMGWTLEDINDYMQVEATVRVALTEYDKKTYGEALKALRLNNYGRLLNVEGRGDEWYALLEVTSEELARFMLEHDPPEEEDFAGFLCTDDVVLGDDVLVYQGASHIHRSCTSAHQQVLRNEEFEDKRQFLTEVFTSSGFDDVQVEDTGIPPHVLDWMREDFEDDDRFDEELLPESVYFLVKTKQGNVGVLVVTYPMLDLVPAGLTVAELHPDSDDSMPERFAFVGLTGEMEQMLRLWQLMVKKQLAAQE